MYTSGRLIRTSYHFTRFLMVSERRVWCRLTICAQTFYPEHQLHEHFPFWLEDENTMVIHREIGPDTYNLRRIGRDASDAPGASLK